MTECASKRYLALVCVLAACALAACPAGAQTPPWKPAAPSAGIAAAWTMTMGNATLHVDFAQGPLDLGEAPVLEHIRKAAAALAAYYGRFPVDRARILVIPESGRGGEPHGTTWGDADGWPAVTRLRVGEHTTQADLDDDWVTTHEMVHYSFPQQERAHHWIEEGIATYVEPLSRVQTGELTAQQVWGDMVRDMHQGEPESGDEGIDRTHTWGRTYWGGALFCLVADVEIRRATKNRKGLQDALKGILQAGGTIDHEWPIEQAFETGDRATGTHVLMQMYAQWKDKPVRVDLDKLWSELGVRQTAEGIEFVDAAPLAAIRRAIAGSRK